MKFNLKKVIASVAALAMSVSCFTAFAADFSDVEATASYKNAIDKLVALEVVNGYEDGTFKPDAEITRAEVTKMVVAAMGPSYTKAAESSAGNNEFSDVKGHWAAGYISVGVGQKFINGMGDGTFAPDKNVTYAQIVKMLVAALGYESAANIAGGYPNGYISTGNQIGVTAGVQGVAADTNVTRAQVAQLIANAIDVPLVVVTNWTTNIMTGEPVAEVEIMDGTGEDYKTLLTEYHNAYKVKGRVTATHAQGLTEAGKVWFEIEYADNYDDMYINVRNTATHVVDAFVGNTKADTLLFTYAEAIIAVNDDDEATIVSIAPYGKNDIYTLAAKDYKAGTFSAPVVSPAAQGAIDFFVSENSSKTKTYKLDSDAKLYVNGIEVTLDAAAVTNYIANNTIGAVTLIDSPDQGSTSKDGLIDYIMVDVAKWAIVEAAMVEGDELAIYLKDFESGFVDTPILLDTEDEDLVYSFTKDGAEVEFDTIKEDDVLLVTYDVVNTPATASNSNFISIEICDQKVSGAVSSIKTVDGVPVYTIAGNEYKSIAGALTAGEEYEALLDAAGRIVKFEKTATSANYGIVDRAWKNTNTDEYEIRIIKADGTRESYVAKDQATCQAAADIAYTDDTIGSSALAALEARVITYKTNTSGEIREIALIDDLTATPVTGEFLSTSNRIQTVRMSETTQILDFVDYIAGGSTSATDIKVGALSTFVDGEDYTVIAGDKSDSDNTYGFVIITAGNAKITPVTTFAVVDSVSTGLSAEGTSIEVINAFVASENAVVALNVDEDITVPTAAKAHGAVVVLGFDADGVVTEIQGPIYTASNEAAAVAGMWSATKANDKTGANASTYFLATGITAWDNSNVTDNNWARVGFGIVLDKIGQSVIMGTVNGSNKTVEDVDTVELSVDSDVNVYVYDYAKKDGARITKGSFGNVTKTFVPDSAITQNGSGQDVYDWAAVNRTPVYAFYKVVNDDITDILVIKPAV